MRLRLAVALLNDGTWTAFTILKYGKELDPENFIKVVRFPLPHNTNLTAILMTWKKLGISYLQQFNSSSKFSRILLKMDLEHSLVNWICSTGLWLDPIGSCKTSIWNLWNVGYQVPSPQSKFKWSASTNPF